MKFLVKSAVAGSLIYVTLRMTHGPWRAPHHMATLARHEGAGFMDHAPMPGNLEVYQLGSIDIMYFAQQSKLVP